MIQYINLLKDVMQNGVDVDNRTGVKTRSVFGRQIRFDISNSFPILTTKKVPFRWVAEELFWFLSGSTNEQHLRDKGVDIWKEWATKEACNKFLRAEGELGPVYGHQWRRFGADYIGNAYEKPEWEFNSYGKEWEPTEYAKNGFDQIWNLIKQIQNNPDSRRLIVSGWNPGEADMVALPPCHTLFQFRVYGDRLSCQLYSRSQDTFLGTPFNITSYALLTYLIAKVCNLKPYEYIHTIGDAHIYHNHFDAVKEQLQREPRQLPTLKINDKLSNTGIHGLLSAKYEDLILENYDPCAKISAPVAV